MNLTTQCSIFGFCLEIVPGVGTPTKYSRRGEKPSIHIFKHILSYSVVGGRGVNGEMPLPPPPPCTHRIFLKVGEYMVSKLLLYFRVEGKEVGSVGQGVAGRVITSQ